MLIERLFWLLFQRETAPSRPREEITRYLENLAEESGVFTLQDQALIQSLSDGVYDDDIGDSDPTLEFLSHQYAALKRELREQYPNFRLGKVYLDVELKCAQRLLRDASFTRQLKGRPAVLMSPIGLRLSNRVFSSFDATMRMDGDRITVRIVKRGAVTGYGFYVHNHPAAGGSGLWCRPVPDDASSLINEGTL